MAPVVIGKDAVLTLPEAGEFDCERYGYLQSGWLIDGVVYAFGDRVVISKDTTITAVYDIAHDVFIVDSEGGVVTSDKSFVLSGETINLAAKADKGYSFTGSQDVYMAEAVRYCTRVIYPALRTVRLQKNDLRHLRKRLYPAAETGNQHDQRQCSADRFFQFQIHK